MVVATASRVSAWVKASGPGLGLLHQPGLAGGREQVLDLVDRLARPPRRAGPGSTAARARRPAGAAPGSASGRTSNRRATTSRTVAGTAPTGRVGARAGRARPGRTGCPRSARATSATTSGSRSLRRSTLSTSAAASAASGRRGRAVRRGGARAPRRPRPARRSARATAAGSRARPAAARGGRGDAAVAAPAGWRCRPSAGPRARAAAEPSSERVSTSRAMLSQARKACRSALSEASSGLGVPAEQPLRPRRRAARRRAGRARRGPGSRATAAGRRRPARSGRWRPRSPRSAAALGDAARRAGTCRCRARPRAARRRRRRPRARSSTPSSSATSALAADRAPAGVGATAVGGAVARRRTRRSGAAATSGAQPLLQRRVLDEHRLLEVAQLLARVEAELVGQHAADVAQRGQRLGLPTRAGQRQRVQRPDPLLQRVPRGGLLGRGHHDGVVAEGEQAEHPVLLGAAAQLVERGRARARPRGGRAGRRRPPRSRAPSSSSSAVDVVGDRRRGPASPAPGRW